MDELAFEKLDGFEEEKVVEQEGAFVADAGDDAPMSVVARLRSILVGISPQQLQHQLGRDLTKEGKMENNWRRMTKIKEQETLLQRVTTPALSPGPPSRVGLSLLLSGSGGSVVESAEKNLLLFGSQVPIQRPFLHLKMGREIT